MGEEPGEGLEGVEDVGAGGGSIAFAGDEIDLSAPGVVHLFWAMDAVQAPSTATRFISPIAALDALLAVLHHLGHAALHFLA